MRDERRYRDEQRGRGVPDGLLIGVLAFLLGMTIMVWSATGLAGLFTKGAWPSNVTFGHTPLAMRYLIAKPHDIPGAWPNTPRAELSGYGLFWGLLIGQLMILVVLAIFVAGTVARWRAVRRADRTPKPEPTVTSATTTTSTSTSTSTAATTAGPVPPTPATPAVTAVTAVTASTGAATAPPPDPPTPSAAPEPTPPVAVAAPTPVPGPRSARGPLLLGPPTDRHPLAVQAIHDAEGPALVVTSAPRVWEETKDARAKLGPVLLYDPTHRCDTPARMHWNPATGCEDRATATSRAAALLAPTRPTAKLDSAVAETAETLLRSYLHAAAVDGKPFRHVHRWAQGNQIQDAVRVLRTSPKAAAGAAGELEAALTSHPERRDIAQELTARALSALSSIHIREACTPNRTDSLTLDSFVDEGGTLYVVGEAIEDPKANPGAMPLLTALVSSVVEHGRRMAERSTAGRLDPPMTLVLDDVAAVAPLPQLPELLATGADRGLLTLALLRSREQGRSRWPDADLPATQG
ncbi:type IV secretory system conjugative DNA transfer family protein [Streptomyces sp. NPDC102406]|uniref:type IV secretory system conjugative DNA transfer family protein n=1 Tax=Streptomyces sp. NPDC102406 TaxID=3366171 RepID=UPI0038058A23